WEFTGPDNRSYKWQFFLCSPMLFVNDNTHTLLARFCRAKVGIVSRPRRSSLEIHPAGLHMVDWIVLTFVTFWR
ncbi:hypothetical protein AMATHDRAFT_97975, partial [Amanita thiersii Skay4041]